MKRQKLQTSWFIDLSKILCPRRRSVKGSLSCFFGRRRWGRVSKGTNLWMGRAHTGTTIFLGLPQFCENLNPFPFPFSVPLIYPQQFANKSISPSFYFSERTKVRRFAAIVGITTWRHNRQLDSNPRSRDRRKIIAHFQIWGDRNSGVSSYPFPKLVELVYIYCIFVFTS